MHVPIDLPPTVEDGFDATPAGWCADAMAIGVSASQHGLAARLTNIDDKERACVIVSAFFGCMGNVVSPEFVATVFPNIGLTREEQERLLAKAKDTRDYATGLVRKHCGSKEKVLELSGLIQMVMDAAYNAGGTIWTH
jgi:hypothetical protein